jgi:oligopeptidase B
MKEGYEAMKRHKYMSVGCFSILVILAGLVSCEHRLEIHPPVAKVIPKQLEKHGDIRIDNYYWLRERENQEVIDYLEVENAYTDAVMGHTKELQEKIYEEIVCRIKETDISVPVKKDDYFYYSREEAGKQYPIYCRKKGSLEAKEEIILDINRLAKGHDFCSIGSREVSFNQDLLAYAVDFVGRRKYSIYIKDLSTGELLEDSIADTTPNMAWANDNKTLFYAVQHPVTLRYFRIYRHVLGQNPSEDVLVYEEEDEEFSCFVQKSKSKKFLFIGSVQTLSTEYRYLSADDPNGKFRIILPREENHEYSVDHYLDYFYIRTNWKAENFRLMKTRIEETGKDHWEEVIPHRKTVFLDSFEIFKDYLVVQERSLGLIHMRIIPSSGEVEYTLAFDEPAYTASVDQNPDFDTQLLRYSYTSLTTPYSVYDYNMKTRERTLLKRIEVLGGFEPDHYKTERLWAEAKDGVKVPISIVYRKGIKRDGSNPLFLYGYGSYGISMDPSFDSPILSLLDRGFVYAIAHVRGGQEMGRYWYEEGKLLKKRNTFTDFIACAEHLIYEKYTSSDRLFAAGGSAGGLLMGAVMNMRGDLFKGILAIVPWVDVVTTMLDDSIPLTTSEYDEWGNPNEMEYYQYMLSYSPYDNVAAGRYPNLLVTTSLHDSQVQYFEPAKWVAKLRALKIDNNRLLFRIKMQAGHGGVSGRYNQYRETAFRFAFILDVLGMRE